MRRILIIVYVAFLLIMLANYLYYKDLYKKQISYIFELLDRQVQIVGLEVDETNNQFLSDLNMINFPDGNLALFFSDPDKKRLAIEKMQLFFSKYENFVTGMKYYDNRKNEFTLKKDSESQGEAWLSQSSILHVQREIFTMEKPAEENKRFNYYLPVIDPKTNETTGNLVVSVDYQKYFNAIFSTFNLQDYQWQWVIGDSVIIYDNYPGRIKYSDLQKIANRLDEGSVENITHNALINDKNTEIISSYYSTQLLQRNLGLVFSAPTDFFQKYIIRNSIFIVLGTLFLIQVIIFIFWTYLKSQKKEMERLRSSEKMLLKLIEEMPVGVIIHNKSREIIKANKIAAEQYSYKDESDMLGKIFPETKYSDVNQGNAANLDPGQFTVIKKEVGEIVLYRKSLAVNFMGEEGTMELFIDVTLLESARKNEVKANVAKSEFLARMSYEIRTPLNGIIGMTDVLNRQDLSPDVKDIVRLLRRSTEVLLNIINDILDFSRIESGKMILDEIPFNIREEIYYCTDLAKTNIQPGGAELISTIDDNVPESIIGDSFRVRQVLTNLLGHSVKNTDQGEIHLKCMLKSKRDGIIKLGFEISDTGTSFDKSSLKKIFGDFVSNDSKAVRNNDESSFGTILSKQLVELMGGELTAESPSGLSGDSGTRIVFSIETYSNERVTKMLPLDQITSFSSIRTLVISGSQNRDEELLASLNKIGLSVNITTFMKQTVNQIKANLSFPDERYRLLIIMDDDDCDGFEAARALWESRLSSNLVILMISSNDRKGNYMKSITMGIDHYMVKPFATVDLLNVLRNSFPYVSDDIDGADANARKDLKILVVEDNKMNQKVLGTMLKNLGYSYDIAEDGYTGFVQARDNRYDLIFMDLIMPEMDGFEASRRIMSIDRKVVIVAFTADNMPETKKKAELCGISGFVPKPARVDDLKRVFARHFRN